VTVVTTPKWLAFAYWRLEIFFRTFLYDDGLSRWKALAVIVCTELAALMTIVLGISVAVGRRIFFQTWPAGALMLFGLSIAVSWMNYELLFRDSRWSYQRKEFEELSDFAKIAGTAAVLTTIALIFVLVLILAHKRSLLISATR
jgi:hypothetical protein